ncbi:hypothetical protein BU23DRAFT_564153 [Bimuria novae-zelandiae CBS 107.79]|uniref:BTB domain-containing protein n=1 Tax=Bimuria novae-zelandiae CBS 107.79 TaxID=1447943 RepID=A0A6A5VMS9_9PLEO|nr:hypothetical protein BU23DRAFT_564153 [Bimuria novae-zelandiae CBS 107.79]
MDDLSFLEQAATVGSSTAATLMVLLPDSSVIQIHNINTFTVLDKCPLLFHAFEFREYGDVQQACIEATSRSAVISLLRFLYTGTYLIDQDDCLGSLLPHAEVFKIAEDFDVPELQVQSYVNFTRDTEFACCRATPPSDLCATIQFLYSHLAGRQSQEHQSLLDTLLNYCISVFTYQALHEQEDFRQTVFENPSFHQDLCKTSLKRNFEDDGASEIMQLPVCRPTPHSQAARLKRTLGDFQYEIWQEGEGPVVEPENSTGPAKKRKSILGAFTLVHRPQHAGAHATYSSSESESESSNDECTLAFRPKNVGGKPTTFGGDNDPESSSDELGYEIIHHPKHECGPEPAPKPTSNTADTCTQPVTFPSLQVAISPGPKDESSGSGSDEEWALV